MSGIPVGIDGSPNAHRALDWAVQEAAARHCRAGAARFGAGARQHHRV